MMNHKRFFVPVVILVLVMAALIAPTTKAGPGSSDPTLRVERLSRFWQEIYGPAALQSAAAEVLSQDNVLLAKAAPDEDYNGVGEPYLPGPPFDHQPKVNQAYAWGMTADGGDIWIGTGANAICTMLGGYGAGVFTGTLTLETEDFVCEFGQSQYDPALPPMLGDWRPPEAFHYNVPGDVFSQVVIPHPLITSTTVLRSAGSLDGVTFLGGPRFLETGEISGINLFAFDTGTGAFLDAATLPEYTNIRKWLAVDGVLYTATGNTGPGGSVLRWRGDAADPFQFEVVGNLDSEGAEIVAHEGRLFVLTWTALAEGQFGSGEQAELYMSPLLPPSGLTAAHAGGWTKVWEVSDYEPDPVIAGTYLGGAMASFDGHLYWGTINFPFSGALAHLQVYGGDDPLTITAALLGGHRSTALFRGRAFGTPGQQVELVYGNASLPVYVPPFGWFLQPNNMDQEPLYGEAGYGNFYNAYTWSMAVVDDALHIGTFDWSYLSNALFEVVGDLVGLPINPGDLFPLPGDYGADLYRLSTLGGPAVTVSNEGVGNYANYGIRNMVSLPGPAGGETLYVGTANPMNLMTDLADDRPEGGWEFRRLDWQPTYFYLPLILR